MNAQTIIILAALPFVLNPALSEEEKRNAWQTAMHRLFLIRGVCGCVTHSAPCFLQMSKTEQDTLIPNEHNLSFHTFTGIIIQSREKFLRKIEAN